MRLQTRKPQKLKEKLIGNHKETQNTLKIGGSFHFTRLVIDILVLLRFAFAIIIGDCFEVTAKPSICKGFQFSSVPNHT